MNEAAMREAIRLSIEKMSAGGGGPFGAVILRQGDIIGRGWNEVVPLKDPTAHAEVQAIREACRQLGTHQLSGCEIYCSCEPCPMCLGAIYWARLDRIWYAATREDAARAGFDDDYIYRELALSTGRRTLPTAQGLSDEALTAFRVWDQKPDKVRYWIACRQGKGRDGPVEFFLRSSQFLFERRPVSSGLILVHNFSDFWADCSDVLWAHFDCCYVWPAWRFTSFVSNSSWLVRRAFNSRNPPRNPNRVGN
jgi:guanine deaminase